MSDETLGPSVARTFALGVSRNRAYVVIEASYGVRANSTALLPDCAHSAGDVLGLGPPSHGGARFPERVRGSQPFQPAVPAPANTAASRSRA